MKLKKQFKDKELFYDQKTNKLHVRVADKKVDFLWSEETDEIRREKKIDVNLKGTEVSERVILIGEM